MKKTTLHPSGLLKGRYTPLGFETTDEMKLGYAAAKFTRDTGQNVGPLDSGADAHTIPDLQLLRSQAQAFWRDNGIYRGIITRIVDNVLGSGAILESKTSNPDTNTKLERLWKAYWNGKPEVRGIFKGPKIERMMLLSVLNGGDFGSIKTNKGQLQLVEAELIYTPSQNNEKTKNKIVQGVEMDEFGAPVAFYRCTFSRYGWKAINPKRIAAEDFIFVANLERPSQTRGTPFLTSIFANLHRINDILNSECVAAQLLSKLAISITKKDGPQVATSISDVDPARPSEGAQDLTAKVQDFDWGTIFQGDIGETIAGIDRNIPGPNFTDTMTMLLRLLGQAFGMPLELILLDWSKTNYSSARAALEQFFVMVIGLQAFVTDYLCEVYKWKVQEWIDDGEIDESDDIFEHGWILPTSAWVDQLKEAEAQGAQLDRGLTTHASALKSLNRTREDFLATKEKEISEAIEKANAINAKFPDSHVPWQIFAGHEVPGVMEAVAKMEAAEDEAGETEETEEPESPEESNDPNEESEPVEPETPEGAPK